MFRHSSASLAVGFAVVILLLGAITVIGLTHMAAINRNLSVIATQHSVKMDLVASMRNAARERTVSLHRMALISDPFRRDDEYLYFRRMAWEFVSLREHLSRLPLTPEERRSLEASYLVTTKAVPIQERVHDLLNEGDIAAANQLLLMEAAPAQNEVFAHFSEFLDYQRQAMKTAVQESRRQYHQAFYTMILLGALSVILGGMIAMVVVRRTTRAEQDLFSEKERAEVTLNSVADAVVAVDVSGRIEYLNHAAQRLSGWAMADAQRQPLGTVFKMIDEVSRESIPHSLPSSTTPVATPDQNRVLVTRDGQEHAIEAFAAPRRGANGAIEGYVVVFRDVTQARRLARELTWQATHDALTGLGNRLEFESVMTQMWVSAKSSRKQHTLVYLDLDQFKIVNDTCGHAAGDELLRQLAVVIGHRVREGDSLFRLGGDEFAVLLNGCPLERAETIADEMRRAMEEFRFVWQNKTFSVGASFGLVPISAESENVMQVLAAADAACYAAKEKGRNRIQVYQPRDTEFVLREGEMRWLPRINGALQEDRLILFYQKIVPVLASATNAAPQYELLLRMRDEQGQLVSPQAFIPAAERYNLMPAIDRWVVRRAMDWMIACADAGQLLPEIHINLSGQSMNDDKFLAFVLEQIRRLPGAAERIGFEVTETAAIANLASALRLIKRLNDSGCRFALDDFGSGMSSFAYLKNLPVNRVKIDGLFVRDMLKDKVDYAMVEAINRIGHVIGIETVAEFVENGAILEQLRKLGVDYAQGFGLHRPEPLLFPKAVCTASIQ